MRLSQIVDKYRTEAVKTAGVAQVEDTVENAVKTAHENGAHEAESMMKVAAAMGDVIGNRIADVVAGRLAESFGYDPEVMKTASLQDVMTDAMYKVAEQVTGTTANAAIATQQAEELQITELAAHHANLAAQSASDAVQSLQQGDEHTATQAMSTAANAIEVAKNLASRVQSPEINNHVNEAAKIVAEAASMAAAHQG